MTDNAAADEQLQADLWEAMRVCKVTTTEPVMLLEMLRRAARDYADRDVIRERRRVLRET